MEQKKVGKKLVELENATIFITGVAGFIGANLAGRLLKQVEDIEIVGIDNMNNYYDVQLKEYRLEKLAENKKFLLLSSQPQQLLSHRAL